MVETAITKVFCSQLGWEIIDATRSKSWAVKDTLLTNEIDRIWRDNRIHRIVEGSNEVMQPFRYLGMVVSS